MHSSFDQLAAPILAHPRYQALRDLRHHGEGNSVYDHSVAVAQTAYAICRRHHCTEDFTAAATRAALLHDFFGYDWHEAQFTRFMQRYHGLARVLHMHAFIHGDIAAKRARRIFRLTDAECDAIRCHMFPLAPLPRTRLAWIVTLADKIVATQEMTLACGHSLQALVRRHFA